MPSCESKVSRVVGPQCELSRFRLGVGLAIAVLGLVPTAQAAIILSESFETDGQNVRYIASDTFNVNQSDNGAYWDRGENDDFNTIVPYTNPDGSFFWAAESVDWTSPGPGGNGNEVQTLDIGPINIAAVTGISFTGLFASTATALGPGFPFDLGEGVRVKYSVDGGPLVDGLCFAPENWPALRNLAYDADCNGDGESGVLTDAFATFGFDIPDGTTLDIHIEVEAPGSSQEVAFDLLQVLGVAVLAGDYNFNGKVEAGDYTVWANTFGEMGPNLPADGNGNLEVDAADYTLWANNFGLMVMGPESNPQAVPEPNTFLLAIVGTIGLSAFRRRRRR